jgi:hypothetical protein
LTDAELRAGNRCGFCYGTGRRKGKVCIACKGTCRWYAERPINGTGLDANLRGERERLGGPLKDAFTDVSQRWLGAGTWHEAL